MQFQMRCVYSAFVDKPTTSKCTGTLTFSLGVE